MRILYPAVYIARAGEKRGAGAGKARSGDPDDRGAAGRSGATEDGTARVAGLTRGVAEILEVAREARKARAALGSRSHVPPTLVETSVADEDALGVGSDVPAPRKRAGGIRQ